MNEERQLYIGLIKWYDEDKGFGVISTLMPESIHNMEVFFHHSNWCGKRKFCSTSNPIVFQIRKRKRRDGYEALKCDNFKCSIEHWQLIYKHKLYNTKAYISDYSKADVLEKCITMISDEETAQNFVVTAKEWHLEHPIFEISDLECYLSASKSVNNSIFIDFLREYVLSQLSLEQRIERFKKHNLSLAFFTTDECLSLIDSITVDECKSILAIEPEKTLFILTNKVDRAIANFNFELKFDDYSSSVCGNLQELFEALCATQSDIDIQEKYRSLINKTVFEHKSKWEELCISLTNSNKYTLKKELNRLLQLPTIFSAKTKNILRGVTISYIKKKLPVEDVVWLMLNDGLSIDEDYLTKNIHQIEDSNFKRICQSEDFSDDYIKSFFTNYVQINGYIHIKEVLSIIKETPRLNEDSIIDFIKDQIDRCLPDLDEVISILGNYEKELTEDFIYGITLRYLNVTHNIKPLLRQITSCNNEYRNKIKDIVNNCHILHPEWVTYEYTNSFSYKFAIAMPDEFYHSLLIQLYKNTGNSKWCMEYANKIGGEVKVHLEKYMISVLSKPDYMDLWQEEICNILPNGYLNDYFDDVELKYSYAESWISKGRIETELLSNILLKTFKSIVNVHTQKAFRTAYLIYKFYVYILKLSFENCLDSNLTKLFKWAHDKELDTTLTVSYIFSMFALFPEDYQIRLFKKFFAAKKEGLLDFSLEDLSLLSNPSSEYLNELEKPKINLSVSVIIDSLQTYATKGRFLADKQLLSLVFKYANKHSKEIFRIRAFFDKCTKKKYRYYPWEMHKKESYIFPIIDAKGNVWYIIKFAYNASLVMDIKSITSRRYHPQFKVWFVPKSSEEEVISFAKRNNFLILRTNFTVNDILKPLASLLVGYDNMRLKEENVHLSTLKESTEQPPNDFICEGRESQKSKEGTWWCIGHLPCANCAMIMHHSYDWEKYTLLDFCSIFNLDVSEENIYGQFKKGSYALFMTTINKFNSLLEHLYCRECGELLYPIDSNYSVNGATNFCCVNDSCIQHATKIYLNHCYSQKCRGVIDSRDTAKCPNGLVICKDCGTCCSTEMFRFRANRLSKAGCGIPPDLVYKIESDAGHLEHKEFYCFKCGTILPANTERSVCQNCGTMINYNPKLRKQ